MAWSQSQFLQALGWATLNSLWQMGLLWGLFLILNFIFKFSAVAKYKAGVLALFLGFGWFLTTFILFYSKSLSSYVFFENTISYSDNILHISLVSASVTYLLLLSFPAYRFLNNWRFVQAIRTQGQTKADVQFRLFVQKIAAQLGISKKVKLVVSNLISSPVTVGYLKPMILLPVAALNQLSVAQVEAILLHELSHIRRYDYLVNLVVSVIHVLLYFNPFVKAFLNVIENERENCCDQAVLQFGYDKVGYASALLHLEKTAAANRSVLTMAASGNRNLLNRIEKIVGMEKKKSFKLVQVIPLFAALACVVLFNSVLLIRDAKNGTSISYNSNAVITPWQLNNTRQPRPIVPLNITQPALQETISSTAATADIKIDINNWIDQDRYAQEEVPATVNNFIPVELDEVDGRLTLAEKADVKTAIEGTKKVVAESHWKQIEASVAEVLTDAEKEQAKQQYLQEVNNVDWSTIEQNVKANYDKINWPVINEKVAVALEQLQIDSVTTVYAKALKELEKLEKELKTKSTVKISPLPDCSVEQINMAKQTLSRTIDSIKSVRPKKIVRL